MRRRAGMTQREAAGAAHVRLGTLRNWEQGVCEPDGASIVALAELYGCTTDDLLESAFAGRHVPPRDDARLQSIVNAYCELSEDGRNRLSEYAEMLLTRYRGSMTPSRAMTA